MPTDMPGGYGEFLRRYWASQEDIPKHERLRQAITASIADGYWEPGARLPTESEWAAATPCSLGTVQRALRNLVNDGLIDRRRGSGTTVQDVNQLVKQFQMMQKMMKQLGRSKGGRMRMKMPFAG